MNEKEKALVGEKAAESFVKDGMIVGIGTGSTVYYTIVKLGEMVKKGLSIKGVATSKNTELLAEQYGIPLLTIDEVEKIDVAIDGADEINGDFHAIKGGGGALFREKVIATLANKFVVVADSSKLVNQLGRFPLPVEVVPFGVKITERYLQKLGCSTVLREKDGQIFSTDNGNYIIDCHFELIENPNQLATTLNSIVGVVENGLFLHMVDHVVTLNKDKEVTIEGSRS
ncbi:ribose-5-phosphate isomerase RpiA [Bacillus sp. B1-b2]|nr:ribose-5-phosphate isomerase RpiA [Bacillus sp. B1-b2]KAB7666071.1 ribose-5-phosphate isomerase RpiA [Bacillus sp. B1-b2]